MPSAVHLAIGAVAGALLLQAGVEAVVVGLVAIASALLGMAVRAATIRPLPLALGVLLMAARGLGGSGDLPTAAIPDGDGPWSATVESIGATREGSRPAMLRLDLEDGTAIVGATLPWYPPVGPGDRVVIDGQVRPPPDGPYGEYLARLGAVGTLRARALELLPPDPGPGRWLEELRRAAASAIERSIPEPEAGLAAGVLIGLRDRVDRTLAADFTTAGASHVVAISGWNIAIVASALAAVAGGLDRRRRSILTAIAIAAYVAFVGPSASVVRAAAMAGVTLLALELGRRGTAAGALGLAVTGLLVADPAWVDDAGFRLSALATLGIIVWGATLTKRLAGPAPGRPRRWLAEILGISLAAQVATLPVVLLDFGRLSLVAPLVNVVVVPLVPTAMAAGALALAAGLVTLAGLPAGLATLAGLPAWGLYGAIVAAVRVGAGAPFASVQLEPPWDGVAAAASAAGIVVVARLGGRLFGRGARRPRDRSPRHVRTDPVRRRANRLALGSLAVAVTALGLTLVHRPDGVARIVVLDVGQGDAILVEGGNGGRLLVDGGPDPGRLLIALDERLPPWDRRVDAVILTHPHEDHVAGLAVLLRRYRVDRVYEPGMLGPGPGYAAWLDTLDAAEGGPSRWALATGDRLAVDDVRLRVLWPDPGRVPEQPADGGTAINNVSIVLLGEVGGRRFLLTGDVEEGVDPELVARGLPVVDVLKVAHHGSRTASTEAFLAAVRPRVAIVSAGRGNPYGHPAPSTLGRLATAAGRTLRTDLDGTVEVAFDGSVLRVRAASRRSGVATPLPAPGGAALAFLCGVPGFVAAGRLDPPTGEPRGQWPVAAPLQGLRRPGAEPPRGRPGDGLRYHRPDGERAWFGDLPGARLERRGASASRAARVLLGRRCLRRRGGGRGLPARRAPLPCRTAGGPPSGHRAGRPRPPPR